MHTHKLTHFMFVCSWKYTLVLIFVPVTPIKRFRWLKKWDSGGMLKKHLEHSRGLYETGDIVIIGYNKKHPERIIQLQARVE